jgi:hypothetical protein
MARRLELHTILKDILGSDKVYFQPPPNLALSYPCIVYSRDNVAPDRANNGLYHHKIKYSVTLIDRNPDSPVPEKILELPLCSYERFFTADNLNHDVFYLFY